MRGGHTFALTSVREARPRRFDGLTKRAVAVGELDLLPAPQLVAKPAIATRFRGLPLQRAALLLDLEHYVVDACEVLLRGLELQLRLAAAALVFRAAGGSLAPLAAVGSDAH